MRKCYTSKFISLGACLLFAFLSVLSSQGAEHKTISSIYTRTAPFPEIDPATAQKIKEVKERIKKGVDTWDPELMKEARDKLLGLLVREKQENL